MTVIFPGPLVELQMWNLEVNKPHARYPVPKVMYQGGQDSCLMSELFYNHHPVPYVYNEHAPPVQINSQTNLTLIEKLSIHVY
jgi:hypothetical protein